MRIKILGNGGFVNNGIPYNSFVIDDTFLIEAPPDIMISLKNNGIRYYDVTRIFISHFHGDHYFGMPFIVLNLLEHYLMTGEPIRPIDIIGPHGLRSALVEIQQLSTSLENPSVAFIDEIFRFTEIDSSTRLQLDMTKYMIFHEMAHSKPTYGFSVIKSGSFKFTYLCDTTWSDSFAPILANKPAIVFCDLNSHPGDKIKQHMSECDIIEKAIPITGTSTRYVGVHLSGVETRDSDCLKYSRIGEEYDVF